ncbi:deaminase domain-containing protein, partial [bacterium]
SIWTIQNTSLLAIAIEQCFIVNQQLKQEINSRLEAVVQLFSKAIENIREDRKIDCVDLSKKLPVYLPDQFIYGLLNRQTISIKSEEQELWLMPTSSGIKISYSCRINKEEEEIYRAKNEIFESGGKNNAGKNILYCLNVDYDRTRDAEYKLLRNIYGKISKKIDVTNVKQRTVINGTITINLDVKPCVSCILAISHFAALFPNIKIEIIKGDCSFERREQMEKIYEKYRKNFLAQGLLNFKNIEISRSDHYKFYRDELNNEICSKLQFLSQKLSIPESAVIAMSPSLQKIFSDLRVIAENDGLSLFNNGMVTKTDADGKFEIVDGPLIDVIAVPERYLDLQIRACIEDIGLGFMQVTDTIYDSLREGIKQICGLVVETREEKRCETIYNICKMSPVVYAL